MAVCAGNQQRAIDGEWMIWEGRGRAWGILPEGAYDAGRGDEELAFR